MQFQNLSLRFKKLQRGRPLCGSSRRGICLPTDASHHVLLIHNHAIAMASPTRGPDCPSNFGRSSSSSSSNLLLCRSPAQRHRYGCYVSGTDFEVHHVVLVIAPPKPYNQGDGRRKTKELEVLGAEDEASTCMFERQTEGRIESSGHSHADFREPFKLMHFVSYVPSQFSK